MTGRLGRDFGRLWTAASVSTLGDGITLTAGPLLAATLTRDPLLIGVVGAASFAPWALVGLVSGALVDRLDRRRVMWTVDLGRAAVLALLAIAILAGWASIPLLAAGAFLLGTGQTLFDSAAQASIPALVGRDPGRLATANGRLLGAQTVSQQFAGPPAGGSLFTLAPWLPYAADAVSFLGSSVLIGRIRGRFAVERSGPATSLRADIAAGLRWLARHRLLRGLALLTAVLNLVFMAAEVVLVLLAQDRLGLGNVGYGLLLTSTAAGSLLGSLVTARVTRWWGEAGTYLVAVGLLVGVLAVLGLTTLVPVAAAALAVLGFAVTIGNVIVQSLRQAVTPAPLLGRVVSVYRLIGLGAVPVGALVGGLLGRVDLRLPYLAGAAVLVLVWLQAARLVRGGAIDRARVDAAEPAEAR
ncbi:MAG: MFS transporter [Mycobacteriales bacterium]